MDKRESMDKIVRASVTDQIFDALKEKIISGEWAIGEKIPSEIELANQLGISRISLRMAIQKLNVLGLTETRTGEGTFVRQFSVKPYFSELNRLHLLPDDEEEMKTFKYALEATCIQLAVSAGVTRAVIGELDAIVDEMDEALEHKDLEQFHEADYRFHLTICNLTQNRFFAMIYDAFSNLLYEEYVRSSMSLLEVEGGRGKLIKHHRNIIGTLENQLKYNPNYRQSYL